MSYKLNPAKTPFLSECCTVMKLEVKASNILQSKTSMQIG